jgi:hypothetical protein
MNQQAQPGHVNQFAQALNGAASYPITLAVTDNASAALTVTNAGIGGSIVTDGFRMTASGIILPHIATPSAPGASKMIIYPKSDNLLYYRSGAAGAETKL